MRKLTLSLAALVAASLSFTAPVIAQELEYELRITTDVMMPTGLYRIAFCGPEVGPNTPCKQPVPDENGNMQPTVVARTDSDGDYWVNLKAFQTMYLAKLLGPTETQYLRDYAYTPQFMVWRSTMQLPTGYEEGYVEVTPTMVADLCDYYTNEPEDREGFFPVLTYKIFNERSGKLRESYMPSCMVWATPTAYLVAQRAVLGEPPVLEGFVTLQALAGMLEDGRWFVDYELLQNLGGTDEFDMLLACKSDYPLVNENGETVMQNGQVVMIRETRAACQPGSPANADNMDAPLPYFSFIPF